MISGHSISTGFRGLKGCQQDPRDRGVTSVVASTMQISSAKDKNPIFGELYFYGVIFEIWDLCYTMFRITIFKCDWVNNNNDIKVDELGFTLIDLTKVAYKSD